MGEFEAADGDVVEVVLGRVEDGAPDVDLDELVVGVRTLEVGPDRRLLSADLGVPDEPGLFGVRGSRSTVPVQSSITSVRSGGSDTSERVMTS